MVKKKLDILVDMSYFAKCKKVAIKNLMELIKPLNNEQCSLMNIFYNSYFTYWLGLVDYLIEDVKFVKQKDIENLLGSEDNYYYIRNLRNAVVHRAEDLSNKGMVFDNTEIVVPFSPVNILDKKGNKVYQPFHKDLMHIIKKCEDINTLCLSLIEKYNLTDYPDYTKEDFINVHKNDPYIPEYAKTDTSIEDGWEHYCKIKDDMKKANITRLLSYFDTNNLFEI